MGYRLNRLLPAVVIGLCAAFLSASWAQEARSQQTFSAEQDAAIREIVRDYLLEHPEVLVDALRVYERRQNEAVAARQREAVAANLAALADDQDSPVLGNPKGDVLVVEFFDYRCPYCRRVADKLRDAVAADGNIRLVMKEFPILGPESIFASRAALAAAKQGRYEEFHFALMASQGQIDDGAVIALAEQLGLDMDRLREDMLSQDIDEAFRRTYEVTEALEIRGTPAFVIGDRIYPGAIEMDEFKRLVAEVRAESKS